MKKIFFLVCAIGAVIMAHAQSRPGKKYINFGYVSQKMTEDQSKLNVASEIKSNFGAFYSSGKTYFLNRQPVAKLLHFGIDVTFLDLNYSKFSEIEEGEYQDENGNWISEEDKVDIHKAEVGLQVGPSIHLFLPEGINVSGYVRYAPSYSLLYQNEEFSSGFANMFTSGLTFNYKVFGVGAETRWGKTKHNFSFDVEDLEEQDEEVSVDQKLNLKGFRVFLSFRF